MLYFCLVLFIISILLTAHLLFLNRAIQDALKQMEEIEEHPERNRQLKAIQSNRIIEGLFNRINRIYMARQQERIVYQRRETQIRREIENISHDLRTPLTSIIGYVDLIRDTETKEEEKQEYLDIIYKRARVLQGFIQDFYEISRIEGDDYPFLLDTVSVQSILSDAAVAYYNEFERKHIHVMIDLSEKQSFIIADKIQLNRILNNLIQNALKYAQNQFCIQQSVKDGRCIIKFINDKGNMKEEELKLIFDRFYTGDQTRNNGSTGLGLTITKMLVEKMKGCIDARFENDSFVIELQWMERIG
jgi:Osmosensitive K+ channel histidine kinase